MPEQTKHKAAAYRRCANETSTALYCRTANKSNPIEFDGIEGQKDRLLRFAEENGFANPVLYVDNGKSGLTLDRPAMRRLIADIKSGNVQTVIVVSADRIARGFEPLSKWTLLLKGRNVKCIAANTVGENPNSVFSFWLEVYNGLCVGEASRI